MTNNQYTEQAIDEAWDAVSDCDDIDPAFPLDALAMIADYHDFDLIEVFDRYLRGFRAGHGPESLVFDIIDASQSNPDRAVLSMRWMTILDQKRAEL
jgi:hypothetical protein